MTDYTPEALEALRATVDVELAALQARNGINTTRLDLARLQFREALDDALRTGQLIHAVPSGDEVEAVARKLAPFMEGGREYDQMPATRRELKIWSRNGMALINDATQDDAQEAAAAAITALDAVRKARENGDG